MTNDITRTTIDPDEIDRAAARRRDTSVAVTVRLRNQARARARKHMTDMTSMPEGTWTPELLGELARTLQLLMPDGLEVTLADKQGDVPMSAISAETVMG